MGRGDGSPNGDTDSVPCQVLEVRLRDFTEFEHFTFMGAERGRTTYTPSDALRCGKQTSDWPLGNGPNSGGTIKFPAEEFDSLLKVTKSEKNCWRRFSARPAQALLLRRTAGRCVPSHKARH